jgi:2-polyprenyl-3-methyl-5-hydroxy-6-metoxy-1,4-benzoquinol methylase
MIGICYLCGSNENFKRPGVLRDNYPEIDVLECSECGFVFLSKQPEVDYQNECVHDTELNADDKRRAEYLSDIANGKSLLDFGCGSGNLLRLLKGDIAGLEPCLKTKEAGFPLYRSIDEINRKFDIITMFHSIEHLTNPRLILIELRRKLKPGGMLVIETPNSDNALLTLYNCKAFQDFTYWAGHPYLFNENTLTELAKQSGYTVESIKGIQRYPLSAHLYWLAEGKPGGQNVWGHLDGEEYVNKLAEYGITDTIIGIFK